jgi:inner membrane protein
MWETSERSEDASSAARHARSENEENEEHMDTLTHGLAGAILGRAGSRAGRAVAVVAVASVGAMFPDLDAFFLPGRWFSMGNTMDYLRYHRGVTHSFLTAPFFALAIALVARLAARRTPLPALWAAALAGIVSHILFDWITSYGTMFFSPLSWRRYALDWVFILDPYFTGIPLVTLVLALAFRARAQRIGIAGSILLFAYVGLCAVMHAEALACARRIFPGSRVSALPQPFSPRRWALFADRGDSIDVAYVKIGGKAGALPAPPAAGGQSRFLRVLAALRAAYAAPAVAPIERFQTLDRDPAVAAARRSPDVAAWRRFARFPVARVETLADGGSRVTFTDLRFRGPWGRRPAFQYEVLLSPSGSERAAGFVRLFVVQDDVRRK